MNCLKWELCIRRERLVTYLSPGQVAFVTKVIYEK